MRRKSVFISGAGRGIGRAIAEKFLQEGYVVGAYTRSGKFAWGKDVEDNLYQGQVDVADPESYKAAIEDFMSHTGGQLDILVNNAGVAVMGEFENQKYEDEKALFDTNVMGCINGVHVALPYLKDTKDAQIVNISSGASFTGTPDLAVYSAAKFAIRGLTEALDIELMKYGIRVIDVNPMFVKTDMVMDGVEAGADVPIFKTLGLTLMPEDVANVVYKATRDRARKRPKVHYPVGWQARILSHQHLLPNALPRAFTRMMAKRQNKRA